MRFVISTTFLVVFLLSFSGLNEATKKNKNHHHDVKKAEANSSVELCPVVSRGECRRAPGVVYNECDSDNDCKKTDSSSKCCKSMCGDRVCSKSVKVSTKQKPGSCPINTFDPLTLCGLVDASFFECRHDSECAGNKKCCPEGPCGVPKCKDSVEERKGECPPYTYNLTVFQNCKRYNESNFECRKDNDCKNTNQKCCLNPCRLLTCQNATQPAPKVVEKPGSCPISTFDPLIQCMPVDPKFWECRVDSECNGTQKCCPSGPCGVKKCQKFVNERKGACPESKFNMQVIRNCSRFNSSDSQCSQDSDCKKNVNQKCCLNECRLLTCQNAIAKKIEPVKPHHKGDNKGPKIHIHEFKPENKKDDNNKNIPKPEAKNEKAGSCPISTFDPLIQCMPVDPIYWDCRLDSECNGTQKCCEDGPCGVKKCKAAVEERKGKCPVHKYDYSVIQNCKSFNEADFECRKDADCKTAGQKCCRNPCFLLTCQNPVV